MQKQIISEVVLIDKPDNLTTENIETVLNSRFGEVIRWAIIDVSGRNLKINLTYIKKPEA